MEVLVLSNPYNHLIVTGKKWVNYHFIYPHFFPFALKVPFYSFGKIIVELVDVYIIVGIYSLFYFVKNWYEQRQQVKDLLQEKTVAELELLQSQVQPHFIFNTLNNIYSTALKTSPETAKLIAYLSSFLNYNLYDAKQDFVPLIAELNYIKNYIELQRNRYGEKLDAAINVYNDISDVTIAPLLLLPLVENSFKHGIANSIGRGWIRIDISKQSDKCLIKIENSVEAEIKKQPLNNSGLGLKNVKRRFELIYPDQYEFKILQEQFAYLVVLSIKIL